MKHFQGGEMKEIAVAIVAINELQAYYVGLGFDFARFNFAPSWFCIFQAK